MWKWFNCNCLFFNAGFIWQHLSNNCMWMVFGVFVLLSFASHPDVKENTAGNHLTFCAMGNKYTLTKNML